MGDFRFVIVLRKAVATINFNDVSDILERQHRKRLAVTDKWVSSFKFHLREIPTQGIRYTNTVTGRSHSGNAPIIVDKARDSDAVVVIDGNHRLAEARAAGRKTILAYVGENAIPLLEGEHKVRPYGVMI